MNDFPLASTLSSPLCPLMGDGILGNLLGNIADPIVCAADILLFLSSMKCLCNIILWLIISSCIPAGGLLTKILGECGAAAAGCGSKVLGLITLIWEGAAGRLHGTAALSLRVCRLICRADFASSATISSNSLLACIIARIARLFLSSATKVACCDKLVFGIAGCRPDALCIKVFIANVA